MIAMEQRGYHRERAMNARADVANRGHRKVRRPVGFADHRGDSRVSLSDEIVAREMSERPGLAEGRNRAHDDFRIERLDGFVAEAEPGDDAGREIFDYYVDLGHEFLDYLVAGRIFNVDANTFLAEILQRVVTAAAEIG